MSGWGHLRLDRRLFWRYVLIWRCGQDLSQTRQRRRQDNPPLECGKGNQMKLRFQKHTAIREVRKQPDRQIRMTAWGRRSLEKRCGIIGICVRPCLSLPIVKIQNCLNSSIFHYCRTEDIQHSIYTNNSRNISIGCVDLPPFLRYA